MERLCSWPSWISARIRSHSRKGPERPVVPPDHGCDGETVSPSLHSSSQTSAGKPTKALGVSLNRPLGATVARSPNSASDGGDVGGGHPLGEPERLHFQAAAFLTRDS